MKPHVEMQHSRSDRLVSTSHMAFQLACALLVVCGSPHAQAPLTCSPNVGPGTSFGAQYPGGPITFADGSVVFADEVLRYDNLNAPMLPSFADPCAATGIPDYSPNPGSSHSAQSASGATSLGEGGHITLGFADNVLTNSGTNAADLFIFQGGNNAERVFVQLRPADSATLSTLQALGMTISGGFVALTGTFGTTFVDAVDVDALVPGFAAGALRFDAVQLVDDAAQQFPTP